jgi:hypothetical protein
MRPVHTPLPLSIRLSEEILHFSVMKYRFGSAGPDQRVMLAHGVLSANTANSVTSASLHEIRTETSQEHSTLPAQFDLSQSHRSCQSLPQVFQSLSEALREVTHDLAQLSRRHYDTGLDSIELP